MVALVAAVRQEIQVRQLMHRAVELQEQPEALGLMGELRALERIVVLRIVGHVSLACVGFWVALLVVRARENFYAKNYQ